MIGRALYNFFTAVGVIAFAAIVHADPCQKMDAKSFSPQSLINEVTRKDSEIHSVEDLLCRLPNSFLSNYVLVFESRSLQEGTPDAPRAIVFDPNSSPRMFLSFNGKPGQIGFMHVEMINETTDNRFINFTDISFEKNGQGMSGGTIIPGPFATVSTGNLNRCLGCHGDLSNKNMPPRPLFDAIPFWPNVYDSHLKEAHLIPSSEVKDFKSFLADINQYPRYLNLIGVKSKTVRNDLAYEDAMKYPSRLALSNAKLTATLADINMRRLIYLTMHTPDYETYRYAVLGALFDCDDFDTFLPPSIAAQHSNFDFLKAVVRVSQFRQAEMDKFIDQLISDSGGEKLGLGGDRRRTGLFDVFADLKGSPNMLTRFMADTFLRSKQWNVPPGLDKLRWLMEARTNPVDMRQWNIDSEKSNYRFTNGPNYFELNNVDDPQSDEWAKRLIAADPRLKSVITDSDLDFDYANDHVVRRACSKLKPLSLSQFGQRPVTPLPLPTITPEMGRLVVLKKCTGCHSNGVLGAPLLKFHDPKQLLSNLAAIGLDKSEVKDVTKAEYMPKFDSLLSSEIEAVAKYIDSLH